MNKDDMILISVDDHIRYRGFGLLAGCGAYPARFIPHSDSMWPGAPEQLSEVLDAERVPDDEIDKMTHENAALVLVRRVHPRLPRTGHGCRRPRRQHPTAQPASERGLHQYGSFRAAGAGRKLTELNPIGEPQRSAL